MNMPAKMGKTEQTNKSEANANGSTTADAVSEGLSFEQQVDSMGIPTKSNETNNQASSSLKNGKKKLDSVTVHSMLSQAIHSNDLQLLEKSLEVSDRKIIQATVSRLASSQTLPLLDQLVMRLQRKPHRAHILIEWVPELTTQLEALYKTLDARQSVYSKLLRLSGRLDLITSQMETRASRASHSAETEPLFTYNEEDDEEEYGDEDFPEEDEEFDDMEVPSDFDDAMDDDMNIMDDEDME